MPTIGNSKGDTANAIAEAFKALKQFTDLSKLHMSNSKCWFWPTSPAARKALQAVSQHDHAGEIQINTSERDLGVGVSYSKRKNKKVLQIREATVAPQLDRIKRMNSSEQIKIHLITSSPIPSLLFGCESTPVSDTWIEYWTRKIARAAFPHLQGRRSLDMVCLLVPKGGQIDILHAIPSRSLRTLCSHFRKHTGDLTIARDFCNDYREDIPMQNGPVKAIRQALMRLQHQIKPDLQVVDTWGSALHICDSPIQEWELLLKEQLADLARYMARSDMQCINRSFDVERAMKALQSFGWADQCFLRQLMTGAVTPAEVLHNQNPSNTPKCPHCGAVIEDLWHRCWECATWSPACNAHPDVMAKRHLLTEMKSSFGLLPHNDLKDFRTALSQRKEGDKHQATERDLQQMAGGCTSHTDSSVPNNATPWSTATMGMVSDKDGHVASLAPDGSMRRIDSRSQEHHAHCRKRRARNTY